MLRPLGACLVLVYTLLLAFVVARAQSTDDGKNTFRFDTFGDEQLWTDTLQMQHALVNVSPATALAVGLKVDVEALPSSVTDALKTG